MGSTAAADLCSVLSETQRIINAHSRHFLALSVLSILPLSFFLSVYPTIQNIISQSFCLWPLSGVALSLFLFLAFFPGLFVIAISFPRGDLDIGNIDSAWKIWPFVVRIVVPSALQTMLFLYNIAAFTVLYMDCTAAHGELVWEIAEEFAGDYVSLPFDDGKIPHFVSVTYT